MTAIKITGFIIFILNLSGLCFVFFLMFSNYEKKKINKALPKKKSDIFSKESKLKTSEKIKQKNKELDKMLEELDLSDFDELDLDDFD